MSNAEMDKAMDILSEIVQKVTAEAERRSSQSRSQNQESVKDKTLYDGEKELNNSSNTKKQFEQALANKYGEDWKSKTYPENDEDIDHDLQNYSNMVEMYEAYEDIESDDYSRDMREMQSDPSVNFEEYTNKLDKRIEDAGNEKEEIENDMDEILSSGELDTKMDLNINPEIKNALEENKDEMNQFIEKEVVNEKEGTTNLTKEQVEGMLNDHFKQVESLLDEYNEKNLDADTFKDKLKNLTNHIKKSAKEKFSSIKHKTTKPIRDLKSYSRNRINSFMNRFNDKLKDVSHNIDNKFDQQQSPERQKIENTLKSNPNLFKEVALATQLHEIDKHIEKSNAKLTEINELSSDNPSEKEKIEEAQKGLSDHINNMESEKEKLEQNVDKEQTINNVNEQSEEQEQEKGQEKKEEVHEVKTTNEEITR